MVSLLDSEDSSEAAGVVRVVVVIKTAGIIRVDGVAIAGTGGIGYRAAVVIVVGVKAGRNRNRNRN